jgi:SAM-dependent methyltransferase
LGFEGVGTDVSADLALKAREASGVTVLAGELTDLSLGPESFDLVNLDQVMMYVADPRALFLQVARLLAPGGFLRVREYDASSLSARMRGRRYWMYGPTRINVFTSASLSALGRVAALELYGTQPGTEASLATFIAMGGENWLSRCKSASRFALRRLELGPWHFGADTVFYFQKPSDMASKARALRRARSQVESAPPSFT